MPSFVFVGVKPEHIVGIPAGDISEAAYDALSWELQQAVLNNRGSNGGPLYVERPDRATVRAYNAAMKEGQPDEEAPAEVAPADQPAADAAPAPDPASLVIPDASKPPEPAPEPDLNLPLDQPAN